MTITTLIDIPGEINQGVNSAKQATMLSLLGNPRGNYDDVCREPTNPHLRELLATANVGPLRIRGLIPAIESLQAILDDVAVEAPEVLDGLGTAGMFCARFVRGSTTSISNHSWGTAIDLTLNGLLDQRGDRKVQSGLARIAPIFNRHGWFWGAGFRTEDGMHFEASDNLVRRWNAEGRFGEPRAAPERLLSLGDRGPEVETLQKRLNELGADVGIDGNFGSATRAAVLAFQAENGLTADGMVGPETRAALGLA